MVRAFAACAVVLAVCTAAAQTVTPRIVSQQQGAERLGVAKHEPTPESACDGQDCQESASVASAEKPVDKHALLKQKLAELNCLQSEIDELRIATGTPQQILIKLKVIEVSRTKLQKSGVDITALRGDRGANSQLQSTPNASTSASRVDLTTVSDTATVTGLIDQLRKTNVAKVLAEPNLVAVSGRPAALNVGGEVPLPLPPGSKQAVEFKPFGTQLDVLAIAQGDDRVRLELRARVSEVDQGHEIEVGGVRVPGMRVRQVDTGLDLKFGQTGVLSGLVQERVQAQKFDDRVVNHREEVELLFVVTPEFIAPIDKSRDLNTGVHAYRTATSDSEERPGERSLRVTKPRAPR